LIADLCENFSGFRTFGIGVLCLVTVSASAVRIDAFAAERLSARDGRYDVGRALAPFAGRGYTLVTTEAGLLPFVSGWRAVDAWGLNDAHIAHEGLSDSYLEAVRPGVIATHATWSPSDPRPFVVWEPGWNEMTKQLDAYASSHGLVHVAAFGSEHETWNFYVNGELPEACVIARRIRKVRFVQLGGRTPLGDLVDSTVLNRLGCVQAADALGSVFISAEANARSSPTSAMTS
jgi:hypothetical protein